MGGVLAQVVPAIRVVEDRPGDDPNLFADDAVVLPDQILEVAPWPVVQLAELGARIAELERIVDGIGSIAVVHG